MTRPKSQDKKGYQTKKKTDFYCLIYGLCNHYTKNCRDLRKRQDEGRREKIKENAKVRSIEPESQESSDKDSFICSFREIECSYIRNLFFIDVYNGEKKLKALIDTGADVSIINKKHISKTQILFPTCVKL